MTTPSITADSGSSSMPHWALKKTSRPDAMCMAPAGTQSNSTISTMRSEAVRAISCTMAPNAKTIARPTLPTQIVVTA